MPCGGPKRYPRTSFIVQIIFSFWSFEISESILRSQKIIIGFVSISYQRFIYLALFWKLLVFVSTILFKVANYSISLWLPFAKSKESLKRLK